MGGIVGRAQKSTVQYCANTGDMTSWTPHTGGIVGELYQASKIVNCYSTGKMVPLGNGTTDFGGIAGTVWAGTEIRHCYFAGEIDLTKYGVTTPPYKRLGGLVGKVESGTPVFKNNYYTETANVDSCATNGTIAGTAESIDFMKTKEFYDKLTQNGGDYRFNPNGTPLLPEHKYPTVEETPRYYYSSATTAKDEGKTGSPKTIDAGVGMYAVSAALSLTGMVYVSKKKS